MKILKTILGVFIITMLVLSNSCNKGRINPNIPDVNINISINPNTTIFQELNTVGGWVYLDEKPGVYIPYGSRGIIVHRSDIDKFEAYERQPPNDPDACCTDVVCTKLIVGENYPMVKDTCSGTTYFIYDGTIFEGEGRYPLIQYSAVYDGNLLHIYN